MASGGAAGLLMSQTDWASTPLGPIGDWPQSLRSAVSICLLSRFPMVVWWGPDLVFIFNDAYRPVLGDKDPKAIMGRVGREVWPEIWPIIGPMLDGVLQRGEATWSDDQLLPLFRNGYLEECYFTFSYSPIRDETGGVGGVFTAVTETTQRVVGERRLRTLSDLAEATGDARTAEEVCAKAAGALGRNLADIPFALLHLVAEDMAVQPVASSGRLEVVEHAALPLAEVAATLRSQTVDLPAAESDAERPRSALVLPILEAGQSAAAGVLVVGASAQRPLDSDYQRFFELIAGQVATAVADARAYEAERKRAEALAELDRAKTAFFSNVSHEFRTPLTLLLGPLEEELRRARPQQRARLEIVHRNGLRLLRLVNALLDFSRIESGRVMAHYEPVELSRLTADLASAFRSATEAAGLELVLDCPPLAEPAFVDVEMWETIVLNLLSNAFKFTFDGSITVRTRLEDGSFLLEVTDTGVGLPDEEMPRIFDRFHRIRGARSRTHEGTGIGLALVRELVEQHGGRISVVSEVGEGTTFTVSIPAGSAHLPPDLVGGARERSSLSAGAAPFVEEALRWLPGALEEQVEESRPGRVSHQQEEPFRDTASGRVLVVDDNADMRDYLVSLLSQHWSVEAVGDGETALQKVRSSAPDLVLTDVMMPGLDGFQLLRALRSDPETKDVAVVMLSARAGEGATVEGLEAGADDYVVKPFVARELIARVRANLELSRMRLVTLATQRSYEDADRALALALTSIAAVTNHIRSGGDLPALYGRLSETAARLVSARRAVFFRLQDDLLIGQSEAHGVEPALLQQLRVPIKADAGELADRIVFGGEILKAGVVQGEEFAAHREILEALDAREMVAVPWHSGEQPLGLLAVYESLKEGGFTREDVWVLRIAALAAAMVWEHKQAEDAVADANQREANRLKAEAERVSNLEKVKSEFLKLASHELRGPLAVVGGYLSMVGEGTFGPLPEGVNEVLPIMAGKVKEINFLVEEMLETARLEDGKLALNRRVVDLCEIVAEAAETMAPLIPRTHRLVVELPSRRIEVLADSARIGTVVTNLIDNAVRYSPEGGRVEVRCGADETTARVEVQDWGLGIDSDDLPRLFQRFGRIVTKENSHIPGSGLGLYLAHEIAAMHAGALSVTTEPHAGSTFCLSLPLLAAGGNENGA